MTTEIGQMRASLEWALTQIQDMAMQPDFGAPTHYYCRYCDGQRVMDWSTVRHSSYCPYDTAKKALGRRS